VIINVAINNSIVSLGILPAAATLILKEMYLKNPDSLNPSDKRKKKKIIKIISILSQNTENTIGISTMFKNIAAAMTDIENNISRGTNGILSIADLGGKIINDTNAKIRMTLICELSIRSLMSNTPNHVSLQV